MNCEQAKKIDIVDFLARLGFYPAKKPTRPNQCWYCSPFRSERTASFVVDRARNKWWDFGTGEGGSIIDLCIKLLPHATTSEVLSFLASMDGAPLIKVEPQQVDRNKVSPIRIVKVVPIQSVSLLNYLSSRNIPADLARQYMQEVTFELNGKSYYALGAKNNSGGYELRNSMFKGSTSPKDILQLGGTGKELAVFEGMFDFLSFAAHRRVLGESLPDVIVMNSTSFFDKCIPIMEGYCHVKLYLDNDSTGRACTNRLCKGQLNNGIYTDQSGMYKFCKDYNNWWKRFNPGKKKLLSKR